MRDRRFPRWVYAAGSEPDPRFSLANERTFLAWIRTSLTLVAAGVALESLDVPAHPVLRLIAALIFIALGLMAAARSFLGWMRAERAMREGTPLAGPSLGGIIVVGVFVAAAFVAIGLLA